MHAGRLAVFGPRLQAAVAFGPRIRTPEAVHAPSPLVRGDTLAIVDRVVQRHQGRVEIKNREAGGLAVHITLPN